MLVQYLVCSMDRLDVILRSVWFGSGSVCFVGALPPGLGCPGHVPAHLLVESAPEIGFQWDSRQLGWERLGLPVHSAVLEAWRSKVSADLCARKGFCGGPWLAIDGSLRLLISNCVRERNKALLGGVLTGGVWNGFLLGKV